MGGRSAVEAAPAVPASGRAIESLSRADAQALGREASDLARLREAGVPLAQEWVFPTDADPNELGAFLAQQAALAPRVAPQGSQPPPARRLVGLSLWCKTEAL